MTDALVNDKPHFVRLFVESGLNILEYLTYHRLEKLYSSLSDCTPVYSFLQKRLQERMDVAASQNRLSSSPDETSSFKHSTNGQMQIPAAVQELTLYEVKEVTMKEDLLYIF